MRAAETYVALRILSESVPTQELIRTVALPPDKTWAVGDVRRGTTIKEVNNGIEFNLFSKEGVTLNNLLDKLFLRVESILGAISTLPASCETHVAGVIYSADAPELFFDSTVVTRLARCRASVDIDLYQLDCGEGTGLG